MISLQKLFGKDDRFFRLLDASAEEGRQSVRSLKKLLADPGDPSAAREMELARQKERETRQEISAHLIKTFVTSLEREDIEALANALYRIPKTIEKFAARYQACLPLLRKADFSRQVGLVEQAADQVTVMVAHLRRSANLEKVREENAELQRIEGEADKLVLGLLRDLYGGNLGDLEAMALKDHYELLEKAADRCRDAGNVVMHIVLKHS